MLPHLGVDQRFLGRRDAADVQGCVHRNRTLHQPKPQRAQFMVLSHRADATNYAIAQSVRGSRLGLVGVVELSDQTALR